MKQRETFGLWAQRVLCSALLLSATVGLTARADGGSAAPANDQALVDYLSDYVYTLNRRVYVWNWFDYTGHDPIWQTQLSATSPAGFDHLKSMSLKYWESFCSKDKSLNPSDCPDPSQLPALMGTGNMYGPGLYAAVDPVATLTFAQSKDSWALMQMHLPIGLRIFSLQRDGANSVPLRIARQLAAFDCPTDLTAVQSGLSNILESNNIYAGTGMSYSNSGNGTTITLPPKCLLELRKVLKDDLKVDGFVYSYQDTAFKECALRQGQTPDSNGNYPDNPLRNAAFVLASSAKFVADDVRVFTAKTTDDREDRIRIQTLFYKADAEGTAGSMNNSTFSSMSFPNYPGYTYSGSSGPNCNSVNGVQTCTYNVMLCPPGGGTCVNVDAPPPPPPPPMSTVMSNAKVPVSQSAPIGMTTLLWADLDGVTTDSTVSQWDVENLYGCKQTSYIDEAD